MANAGLLADESQNMRSFVRSLRNKERQCSMQTMNRTDYYADGLGTRSELSSGDDAIKPYFKRGGGLTLNTSIDIGAAANEHMQQQQQALSNALQRSKSMIVSRPATAAPLGSATARQHRPTEVEREEALMESGKEYANLPAGMAEKQFQTDQADSEMSIVAENNNNNNEEASRLEQETMTETMTARKAAVANNKLSREMSELTRENEERLVALTLANRRKHIDEIDVATDQRVLDTIKSEWKRQERINLKHKTNYLDDFMNAYYDQEAGYIAEKSTASPYYQNQSWVLKSKRICKILLSYNVSW